MHADKDPHLFNDQDLYQFLLGDFLQEHEEDDGSDAGSQDDEREKHYLGNADLAMTKKAMARKALLKQQPKKDIDRKASKNRKIKYVVHD
jgi:hypothetical protein